MIEDDLIEYKLAIAMLDAIEDELLEKGLNRELKLDHIRWRWKKNARRLK